MSEVPSIEELKKGVETMMSQMKVARMCENCGRWNPQKSVCTRTGSGTLKFMFCPAHEFETETLARRAQEELKEQLEDSKKIESLLALSVTTACSTSCFVEDMERRMKKFYKAEKDKRVKSLLKKDLDMAEQMDKAFKQIQYHLKEIDKQYQFYVQPWQDKLFSENGELKVDRSDAHLNNSFEICKLVGKFVKGCIGHKENYDKVFELLDTLVNPAQYPLTDKDFDHYKLQEYNV